MFGFGDDQKDDNTNDTPVAPAEQEGADEAATPEAASTEGEAMPATDAPAEGDEVAPEEPTV